jgi:UDP-N-acetylglucosamine--N-acetylmuramyl-(pentapeptide) pyrophosphoryl-undecaprenol N-acetylglucosamine transferase
MSLVDHMKLIITGGGTGGHVYPGLAVARELKERGGHTVLFVGAKRGLETKLAPEAGIEFKALNVTGLKGKGIIQTVSSLFNLMTALAQSIVIIKKSRPDVVIGVGGYASGPMGLAAIMTGKPLAIAEQNAQPGLTNSWLGKFAKKAFLSMPESLFCFPKGVGEVTGNPVMPEFFSAKRNVQTGPMNILVIGGSQGATPINTALAQAAALLDPIAESISITHQTGEADLEMMRTIYKNSRFPWVAEKYFHDMPQKIADADLVISRAGAGAVSEICAVGRAAIYIPLPHAADDHQTKNAMSVVKTQAAIVVTESELNGKLIASKIAQFNNARERLEKMGKRARKYSRPGAAAKIVDGLLEMAGASA